MTTFADAITLIGILGVNMQLLHVFSIFKFANNHATKYVIEFSFGLLEKEGISYSTACSHRRGIAAYYWETTED